jgi:hypothetical protein
MTSTMVKLLEFCVALDQRHVRYDLLVVRPEAVMVALAIPGERLEIEFFSDGQIEIERFISKGDLLEAGPDTLDEVLRYFDD